MPIDLDWSPESRDWIKAGKLDLPDLIDPKKPKASLARLRDLLDASGISTEAFKLTVAYQTNVDRWPWLADI